MFPLILASASPRRAELLAASGLSFIIKPSGIPEPGAFFSDNEALENAFIKARDISTKNPDSLVLGADTVIEMDGRIFGKPKTPDEAFQMLKRFSGRTHLVTTGCAILSQTADIEIRFAESTAVTFRDLTDDIIHRYLEKTPVMDKAGAYAIQENGELLISGIGGDRDNVIGLPRRAAEAVKAALVLFS